MSVRYYKPGWPVTLNSAGEQLAVIAVTSSTGKVTARGYTKGTGTSEDITAWWNVWGNEGLSRRTDEHAKHIEIAAAEAADIIAGKSRVRKGIEVGVRGSTAYISIDGTEFNLVSGPGESAGTVVSRLRNSLRINNICSMRGTHGRILHTGLAHISEYVVDCPHV